MYSYTPQAARQIIKSILEWLSDYLYQKPRLYVSGFSIEPAVGASFVGLDFAFTDWSMIYGTNAQDHTICGAIALAASADSYLRHACGPPDGGALITAADMGLKKHE